MNLFKTILHRRLIVIYWISITVLATIMLFGYLDWGEGWFFHPDEINIARASLEIKWFSSLNPHFFAYGGLPIYLDAAGSKLLQLMGLAEGGLATILLFGRFISAVAILGVIWLVYKTAQLMYNQATAYIGLLLATTTVGLIQIAHFATTEALLSLFMIWIVYLSLRYIKEPKLKWVVRLGLVLGLGVATKVVAVMMLAPIVVALALGGHWRWKTKLRLWWWRTVLVAGLAGLVFVFFNPYVLLDFPAFQHSMSYESGVGLGRPLVFYTRQFIDTLPVWFQLERVLPYVLGPVLFILSLVGLGWAVWQLLDRRTVKGRRQALIIMLVAFGAYFLPHAFLFAKWTRFIAPVFVLLVILALLPISQLCQTNRKTPKGRAVIFLVFICLSTSLWAGAFWQVYRREDVRLRASKQMIQLKAGGANFLNESGNVVDLPLILRGERFNGRVKSFDFYELDQAPEHLEQLAKDLEWADYYVVGSRRVWYNHLRLKDKYPLVANFYQKLFTGELGFEKLAEFNSYPTLLGMSLPDEGAEETFTVFDHPRVQVFEKVKPEMRKADYLSLLTPNGGGEANEE